MRILLAEDDRFLADGLCLVLRDSGFCVDHTDNGSDADLALSSINYDLLVLDLGLPGIDGLEVLRRLRQRGRQLPVLILTARDQLDDRVQGLDSGANDYLTKPFQIRELEARIRALIRGTWQNRTTIAVGNLSFDTTSRTVYLNDKIVELTPRELAVLELLIKNRGSIVYKERICDQLSSWDTDLTNNALDIAVHRLRKRLSNSGFNIRTLRSVGYIID